MIPSAQACSTALEMAGAVILQRQPVNRVGAALSESGRALKQWSQQCLELAPDEGSAKDCRQFMSKAAGLMEEAGNQLQGVVNPSKGSGKQWLKNGG